MKKISIKILLVFLLVQYIHKKTTGSDWNVALLHTASEVNYLSQLEKDIILEINKLRTDPARYAAEYIAPLARHYDRRLLHYPGEQKILTHEGVSALHECVRVLKRQQPLPIMHPSYGLTLAARDHVNDQSKSGKTGHTGGDGSSMSDRIERYGKWQVRIAENIIYGGSIAQQVVIYLLIDDGVRDRGHRKNFLNPDFIMVGVAAGSHPKFGTMSVMDFAGGFILSNE